MKTNNHILLSAMMFLQFFVWGAWFATLGTVLADENMSGVIGEAYQAVPLAAIIAPLFLGLIADRFFNCEKTMGILHLIGGALLLAAPSLIQNKQGETLSYIILANMLCYMPTLGLSNTVAFSNIKDRNEFPAIRVWGTIGWIAAGLMVGGLGMSSNPQIFTIAGTAGIALGLFCFALPKTPPPSKDKPVNIATLFMLDAFKLMTSIPFFVFIICSALVCIPMAYYYAYTATYLPQIGFQATASTMALGQISEIFFMLLVPFFYRKLGVKIMILIGMLAWVLRYVLFSMGAPDQVVWMVLIGVILHGICYDFFFVTGFMYADNKAPKEIRGQAQSLLVFFTQGVGMYFGYRIAKEKFKAIQSQSDAMSAAIQVPSFEFWESFGKMFLAQKPEVDAAITQSAMEGWKAFWMFPCFMAIAIIVVFAITFWDKSKSQKANHNSQNPNS